MESTKLILGIINNPPLHLSHEELEKVYQDFTKPFLSALYRYPDVPLTMHFSGPFLEWLQKHHSEYLTVLTEMIRRKQIEILGGGYYSPILPLIPHNDRIGQIEDLTTAVRRLLGKRPRGAWIARSIWEPLLVTNLINTGMEFAFLEESTLSDHREPLGFYPLITENQGKTIVVFSYSNNFSMKVIKEGAEVLNNALKGRQEKEDSILCLVLSGDYWGEEREWAKKFVHEGGMEDVLQTFRNSATEIEGTHPSGYLKKYLGPLQKIYLNNSRVNQLWKTGELSLSCRENEKDHRNFRQFLTDYPVLNNLYCKMMFIHLMAYQIRRDKYKKKSALEDLWRAQASSAYFLWRDQGSQYSLVRKQAYGYLLQAELKARDKVNFVPSLGLQDFDLDGLKEILYQGNIFNFYVNAKGGQLFEIDSLKSFWNYSDVFNFDVKKQKSLALYSFADRFYKNFEPENFRATTPDDAGDFTSREYKIGEIDREQKSIGLSARGKIRTNAGFQPLKVDKKFTFKENGVRVQYSIESLSPLDQRVIFVPELRLSFKDNSQDKLFFTSHNEVRGNEGGDWERWTEFYIHDKALGQRILLTASREGAMTVAEENVILGGDKPLYQGHRFLPHWELQLRHEDPFILTLDLTFQGE